MPSRRVVSDSEASYRADVLLLGFAVPPKRLSPRRAAVAAVCSRGVQVHLGSRGRFTSARKARPADDLNGFGDLAKTPDEIRPNSGWDQDLPRRQCRATPGLWRWGDQFPGATFVAVVGAGDGPAGLTQSALVAFEAAANRFGGWPLATPGAGHVPVRV